MKRFLTGVVLAFAILVFGNVAEAGVIRFTARHVRHSGPKVVKGVVVGGAKVVKYTGKKAY
jgi:hypothetical protein